MGDVSALKQVASDQEIDDLIYFFENNRFLDPTEAVFYNISTGLEHGYVDLYGSFINFEQFKVINMTKLTKDLRHFAIGNWRVWVALIISVSVVIVLFGVELPVRLARRYRREKKTLV